MLRRNEARRVSTAASLLQGRSNATPGVWFKVAVEDLPMVNDRCRRVPALLAEIRRCIDEQDALRRVGIFRCSPDQQVHAFVRGRLEAGDDIPTVLTGCAPDVLASLLKEWYRDAPDGWIRPHHASKAGGKHSKGSHGGNSGLSIKELEAAIVSANRVPTSLLKSVMRPAQRESFMWLLDLLVEAVSHEASSRMGAPAIAVIFAPVLFPPPVFLPPDEQIREVKQSAVMCERLILVHKEQVTLQVDPPSLQRRSSSKRKLFELGSASTDSTSEDRTRRPSDGD